MKLSEELKWRGFVNQTTYEDLSALDGAPISFYWGVDPSARSMTIGNFVAIRQRSIKRMLAYSSIAHAGYMTIGLLVLQSNGGEAIVFYLLAYTLMTVISFGAVMLVTAGTPAQYVDDDFDSFRGVG